MLCLVFGLWLWVGDLVPLPHEAPLTASTAGATNRASPHLTSRCPRFRLRSAGGEGGPTAEQVDALHGDLLLAVEALFDKYKKTCGYDGYQLDIR